MRDEVVDYVGKWSGRTELPAKQLVRWIGVGMSKFYDWRTRYGKVNEHNALVPRDHWLQAWERQAIVAFHAEHPLEGYRRLTYMMMDADLVAVSPATVYRVLTQFESAGLVKRHHFEGGHSVFELNEGAHHDHILCVKCGRVDEFVDELIEQRQKDIAAGLGYEMTDHCLYMYGICKNCKNS